MIADIEIDEYNDIKAFFDDISTFKRMHIDPSILRRIYTRCVSFGFAKKVLKDDKIIGIMFGTIITNTQNNVLATDLLTYSLYETNALIREFENWAKSKEVNSISITNAYGSSRYDDLLERLGYIPYKTHTKEI